MKCTAKSEIPFFSLLIPSYNRPEYITGCIDSILSNDFQDFEIIISDDKSPRALEIEESLRPYIERGNVQFFKQTNNLREPGNKNFIVNQAKGKFTIIIGDDDKLYPDSLSRIRRYITDHPGYDLYSFGYTVIDERDRFYYSRHAPRLIEISIERPDLVRQVYDSQIFPFWLYHPATYCCRNGIEREMPYSDDAGIGEDFLFIFDFFNKRKKMLIIPESLFCWRKIQRKETGGQRNQSLMDFSNIQARKNIYYQLKDRKDLLPLIASFVNTYEYRRIFLYMPMLSDASTTRERLLSLNLDRTHVQEYEKLEEVTGWLAKRYRPYVDRSLSFYRLFGGSGLSHLVVVTMQRAYCKITSWWNCDRSKGTASSIC